VFASRIRKTALALSGAALLATSLMTPVVAAASPMTAAAQSSRAIVPVSDIRVTRLEAVGTGNPGERAFATFEVKNIGQQPMTFELHRDWASRNLVDGSYQQHPVNQNMTLAAGAAEKVTVNCDLPNAQFECYYLIVQARHLKGLDTNMQNNGADFAP